MNMICKYKTLLFDPVAYYVQMQLVYWTVIGLLLTELRYPYKKNKNKRNIEEENLP